MNGSNNDDYDVEKIVNRRIKNGRVCGFNFHFTNFKYMVLITTKVWLLQTEYLLKWLGYSSYHNTWEPEENLSCPDLMNDFIISRAHKILGK